MAEANAKADGEQDQSMEEILQSIRRIIAEESDDPTGDSNGVQGSDVLELTEIISEPQPQNINGGDVLSQIDEALATPSEEISGPIPTTPVAEPISMPAPKEIVNDSESLLSDESAAMSSAALRGIAQSVSRDMETHVQSGPSFRSGTTVEDLAMEALRPMLKQWLDANLPGIVERIVQKEVRRLSSM